MNAREAAGPEFPARLSIRLRTVLAAILVLVLAVGGLAVFLSARISHTNTLIRQEYSHALAVSQLHLTYHDMVDAIEQAEASATADNLRRIRRLQDELTPRLQVVVEGQYREPVPTDLAREAELLGELQRLAADLQGFTARLTSTPESSLPSAETLARLQVLSDRGAQAATSLVDLHHDGVRQLLVTSQEQLRLILMLYVALLVIGVIAVVLGGLVADRWVAAPLRHLAQAAELVAAGRLEARVPVQGRDEIGQLAHAFNVMAERLQNHQLALGASETQLRHKMSQIQALYRIGDEISGLTELEPILQWVVNQMRELLQADVAVLCLVSPDGDRLIARVRSGPPEIFAGADQGISLVSPDGTRAEPCAAALELFPPGIIQGSLTTPLRRGSTVFGSLVVATATHREFSPDDREVAAGFATQAAIAIENARMHQEMQDLAALEERRRLAREIHDGLAQTLALLNLKLLQFRSLLPLTESRAKETAALQELSALAESAYEEARQSIGGLRAAVSRSLGFVPTLAKYFQEFSAQQAIPVHFDAPKDSPIPLSPTVETQVMRIIQEALVNIRKHAAASLVRVRLGCQDGVLRVSIEDDGRGWDFAAVPSSPSHVGLDVMRERAESLGGKLHIDTAPGRGTRITAEVPLEGSR